MAPVESATLEEAATRGVDLGKNAYLLAHGWTAGPMLIEFVERLLEALQEGPKSAGEVSEICSGWSGPVNLVLRTCSILGYLKFDTESKKYTVIQGSELEELKHFLGSKREPSSSIRSALKRVYEDIIPPFSVPSREATYCLKVWETYRPSWKRSISHSLAVLLDGIVLTPLLGSIMFLSRWDKDGNELPAVNPNLLSFPTLHGNTLQTLKSILLEVGLGELDHNATLRLDQRAAADWQRAFSYFEPLSYAPLLQKFPQIFNDDASWGFAELEAGGGDDRHHPDPQLYERGYLTRPMLTVGREMSNKAAIEDFLQQIGYVFSGRDFEKQPQYIIDDECGNGSLLMQIYEFIKNETPRGNVLHKYPITFIGMDDDEEHRIAASVKLMNNHIPNKVIRGRTTEPGKAMAALDRSKIDLTKALHVRLFADHKRDYIPPRHKFDRESVAAMFARTALADIVHLDRFGNPITALNSFASTVEHFSRWAVTMQEGFGVCLTDVMQQDLTTTQKFMNDSETFHIEVIRSLSRCYAITPVAFHMATAMAGLFPLNPKTVGLRPNNGNYSRVISQHLVSREFKIRCAEKRDLPKLMELEDLAWGPQSFGRDLRAPKEGIVRRLETSPLTCFVCTINEEVVAVLYTQRIKSLESIFEEKFQQVSNWHDPNGSIIQLIAINVNPSVAYLGLGQHLRAFALRYADLTPAINSVCAVTICRDFKSYSGSMQEYMDNHVRGTTLDPVVDFHTGYGAKFISLVHNYRPEDVDNQGIGILIQYNLREVLALPATMMPAIKGKKPDEKKKGKAEVVPAKPKKKELPTLDLITEIMGDLGYNVTEETVDQSFFAYDMDSLELVRVRNRLASDISMELPSTYLLDFPTVALLCEQLDELRGIGKENDDPSRRERPTEVVTAGMPMRRMMDAGENSTDPWETMTQETLMNYYVACKKAYMTSHYQGKFMDLARQCYPDMMMYCLAVEPLLQEIQGPLLLDKGLIDEADFKQIQIARAKITEVISRFWSKPEIRKVVTECTNLCKLDQVW